MPSWSLAQGQGSPGWCGDPLEADIPDLMEQLFEVILCHL